LHDGEGHLNDRPQLRKRGEQVDRGVDGVSHERGDAPPREPIERRFTQNHKNCPRARSAISRRVNCWLVLNFPKSRKAHPIKGFMFTPRQPTSPASLARSDQHSRR
jgi:hypothetical protein